MLAKRFVSNKIGGHLKIFEKSLTKPKKHPHFPITLAYRKCNKKKRYSQRIELEMRAWKIYHLCQLDIFSGTLLAIIRNFQVTVFNHSKRLFRTGLTPME